MYVTVTLRGWQGKETWEAERRAEGFWKNVVAYDADDLEQWLELAPAVHLWLAGQLESRPDGCSDLETSWADWAAKTDPPTPPALLLAGRQDVAQTILEWVKSGTPPILTLQASSREEALAVFAAAVMNLPPEDRVEQLARMVVARTEAAWRELAEFPQPLILVPDKGLELGELLLLAQRRKHAVVVPLGAADTQSADALRIARLPVDAAAAELEKVGLQAERARELALLARRSLLAFRRAAAAHDLLRNPPWGRGQEAQRLVPALLAGSWSDAKDGDRAVLTALAVTTTYDQLEAELTRWQNTDDPPLRNVGGVWSQISREDAWAVLSSSVTRADVERLSEQVLAVLGTPHPKFDLPDEDRWAASTHGKISNHSDELCKGLAQTLALLGTRGGNIQARAGRTGDQVARDTVRRLLDAANKDWRIWATLDDRHVLPTLAEAASDVFLAAVDEGLRGGQPILRELFRDGPETDSLTTSSHHIGLLWALEVLAWNPQLLTAAALRLARLAEIDPGGRLMNRPLHSLREIFLSWHPQTTATHEERLQAIDTIRKHYLEVGWALLRELFPEDHSAATPTMRPEWHEWGDDEPPRVTVGDVQRSVSAVIERALEDVGENGTRWVALVGTLGSLSKINHEAVMSRLASLDPAKLPEGDRAAIWDALRKLISHHRSFPNADWAIPAPYLDKIAELLPRFEPPDNAVRFGWLFTGWPEMPDGRDVDDHAATEKAIQEARQAAVETILSSAGLNGVIALAKSVEVPGYLGATLGAFDLSVDEENGLLREYLASSDKSLRLLAGGFVDGRCRKFGNTWIEARVADASSPLIAEQKAELLLSLPTNSHTIVLVGGLDEKGQRHFWSNVNVYRIEADSVDLATRTLVAQGLAFGAVELLGAARRPVDTSLLLEVMEGVLKSEPRPGDIGQMFTHHMLQFFDRLAKDPTIDPARAAQLEWQFIALFDRREHRPHFLQRELAARPEFFLEVLSLVYRGEGEEPRKLSPEDELRARHAYRLLNAWRTAPGTTEDGRIDAPALLEWVRSARRLSSSVNRGAIGDQVIGQVLSGAAPDEDGLWPPAAVRDVIEETNSRDLELGISIGTHNARGVWSKGIHEGGAQEAAIAERYKRMADQLSARYPRTAQMLRDMAAGYRDEAYRSDQEAERREDSDE
jgi:hypothetical protein